MRMIWFRFFVGIGALALALAAPMSADAGTVYVAGFNNEFGTLNLATGAFTQIGILTIPNADAMYGMGFASNGTLYGLDSGDSASNYLAQVWSINPATAAATLLGSTGQYSVGGTVSGNTLYALDDSNSAVLYTVNLSTLNTNVIGSTGFEGDGLVAVDTNGHLFAGENSYPGDNLWSVNPNTAGATFIGDMNQIMFSGFFIGPTLYSFSPGPDDGIYTIDTTTGSATRVGTYTLPNGDDIYASAYFSPAVAAPEPASLTLMLLGGLGLVGYSRSSRLGRDCE